MDYTVKQVAELLNITTRTIYTHLRSGKLKSIKYKGQYVVNKKDLLEFINRQEKYKREYNIKIS